MKTVERAVADQDGVYLAWNSNSNHSNGRGTPAIDRVSRETGTRVWMADRPLNDNHGNWPTIWTYECCEGFSVWETRQGIARNDDGIRVWNKATGPRFYPTDPEQIPRPDWELASNDSWGESLVIGNNLWIYNEFALHGPDLGLTARGQRGQVLLRLNNYGYYDNPNHTPNLPEEQWNYAEDRLGSLASDNGYIYLGADYQFTCASNCQAGQPKPFKNGIYAWNVTDGTPRWPMQETTLWSRLSIAANRLYALEKDPVTPFKARLVIRNAGFNGSILASSELMDDSSTGWQAPVLAGGRVIIATINGFGQTVLRSWDAISLGTPMSQVLPNATGVRVDYYGTDRLTSYNNTFGANAARVTTTMVAAVGSKNGATSVPTLVITSNEGLHVVQISTLQELWRYNKSETGFTDGGRFRDPVIVNNRLYVVDNLRLYAFEAP